MSRQNKYDKLNLLGVEIDAITNVEAIEYICDLAAAAEESGYVVKPYVEFLDRAYRNEEVKELLGGAELALPDGVALTWAAAYLYAGKRSLGRFCTTLSQIVLSPDSLKWPLLDRTAGINFTLPLLEAAADRKLRVQLIGQPKNGDIWNTAEVISKKLPNLRQADPIPGIDADAKPGEVSQQWLLRTLEAVRAAEPDIVLIGMGFPLQEQVCAYLADHSRHGVFIGEGGTFDFEVFGGTKPKAPAFMVRLGLEWLWRLTLEPSRFRRQLAIPRFIFRIWMNK